VCETSLMPNKMAKFSEPYVIIDMMKWYWFGSIICLSLSSVEIEKQGKPTLEAAHCGICPHSRGSKGRQPLDINLQEKR